MQETTVSMSGDNINNGYILTVVCTDDDVDEKDDYLKVVLSFVNAIQLKVVA